jgi:hypothetical protein
MGAKSKQQCELMIVGRLLMLTYILQKRKRFLLDLNRKFKKYLWKIINPQQQHRQSTMEVSSRKTTASMSLTSYQRGQLAHLRSIVLRQQQQQKQEQQQQQQPSEEPTAAVAATTATPPTDAVKETAIKVADATTQSASKQKGDKDVNPLASRSAANDATAAVQATTMPDHAGQHQPQAQRQPKSDHPSTQETTTVAPTPKQLQAVVEPPIQPVSKKTKLL